MNNVIMIVAYRSSDRGIGRIGETGPGLPWKPIKTDMDRFVQQTLGNAVVMGLNTYLSIPGKYRPLLNRENIVITSRPELIEDEGVLTASTLQEAIALATTPKVFLAGGGRIYEEGMQFADTIMATIVHQDGGKPCDTFFPEIGNTWEIVEQGEPGIDPKSEILIQFVTFRKKPVPPHGDHTDGPE
jgi:dihydrofolate reductase